MTSSLAAASGMHDCFLLLVACVAERALHHMYIRHIVQNPRGNVQVHLISTGLAI